MASAGMVNVGQARPRTRWRGRVPGRRRSVGAEPQRLPVPDAPTGTHEDLLHHAIGRPALVDLNDAGSSEWLSERRGHRAIGVVYHPSQDHYGNWVPTTLGDRYDAFISFDATTALHPLETRSAGDDDEQETYPWST